MEQITKMKVAMVCSFSNPIIREHLNLKHNRVLFNFLINKFRLPSRVGKYEDCSPWISNYIQQFKTRKDEIELHVIFPHIGLKSKLVEFELDGIFYHAVNTEFSSFLRIVNNAKIWIYLQRNSIIAQKIISRIHPDIVNVIGLENPASSVMALAPQNTPIYALCQTIYCNPDRKRLSVPKKLNWDLELLLFEKLNYFGVYGRLHYDLLKQHKPNANIFNFSFPSSDMPNVREVKKEFDFVNFAFCLDLRKGAHDTIQALSIVKTKHPNVSLNFVGHCPEHCRRELDILIAKYGLYDNVVFTPFFEKQADMFQHIQKSRFAVLPCKMDVTSGTMSQAMYYGLPLVVYKTTGTPQFNEKKECALISQIGNIRCLADNMLLLMEDPHKAKELQANAKEYIDNRRDNKHTVDKLIANYEAIINNYWKNTPIPPDQLFNIAKFPKYED